MNGIIPAGGYRVGTVSNSDIEIATQRADSAHGASVRGDSRKSPRHVQAQRAMVRTYVEDLAWSYQHNTQRGDVKKTRVGDTIAALAEGLGLVEVNGRIDGMERGDAGLFAGEGVDTDSIIARPAEQAYALSESIPTRSIGAGKQRARVRGVKFEGSADVYKPGMSEVPKADYSPEETERLVHSIVTSTQISWEAALYGQESDLDEVREKAEAANRVLRMVNERLLVKGLAGTDLQGARDIAAVTFESDLDYSGGSVTIAQAYADLINAAQAIQEGNDDRGGPPNAAFIAPSLIRQIMPLNNLAAGGSETGSDIMGAMRSANKQFADAWTAMGITRVIPAPSLNNFGRTAAQDSTHAGIIFCQLPQASGLRKIVALAPSPVRTAASLLGDETLWAMRVAGLEAPIATSVGKYHVQVR